MQIVELSPAEVARLREKTKPVVEKFTKDVNEAVVKDLYAQIEKVRGAK